MVAYTVLNDSLIHPSRLQSSLSTCTCPQKTDSGFSWVWPIGRVLSRGGGAEGQKESGKEDENVLAANFLGAGAKLQCSVKNHCCEQG